MGFSCQTFPPMTLAGINRQVLECLTILALMFVKPTRFQSALLRHRLRTIRLMLPHALILGYTESVGTGGLLFIGKILEVVRLFVLHPPAAW